jgi:hypothetical protein
MPERHLTNPLIPQISVQTNKKPRKISGSEYDWNNHSNSITDPLELYATTTDYLQLLSSLSCKDVV